MKVALPGPYLLSRIMWMECISDRAYASREDLAKDIVRVLREELFFLLPAGAAIVQFDRPLTMLLRSLDVGAYFLELCTPRAGEIEVLKGLPDDRRIGVGVVNPKLPRVETVDEILAKARRAVDLFGRERVLLNPDCGFATFADNPVASSQAAEGKLRAIAQAAERLRA